MLRRIIMPDAHLLPALLLDLVYLVVPMRLPKVRA